MLQLLGFLALAVAAAAFIMHMRTSYMTQGGRLGQDPCVAAAAVQVPLMTMLGLSLVDKTTLALDWPWWQWLAIWLIETVVVAWTTIWIGDMAYKKARMTETARKHDRGG